MRQSQLRRNGDAAKKSLYRYIFFSFWEAEDPSSSQSQAAADGVIMKTGPSFPVSVWRKVYDPTRNKILMPLKLFFFAFTDRILVFWFPCSQVPSSVS